MGQALRAAPDTAPVEIVGKAVLAKEGLSGEKLPTDGGGQADAFTVVRWEAIGVQG